MTGGWQPVTIPARWKPPAECVEFDLTDEERERAARQQARLERDRNEPQKHRRPE